MTATIYPADFYHDRHAHTAEAARRVLAALPPKLKRDRVADIGCGTGTWLAAALEAGAQRAIGYEGEWVTTAMLDDPRIEFTAQDLERPIDLPKVDLCMTLEVAEHLTPQRADSFVANLVAAAPAVLFSAAIPGQGGVNHLNEQWHSWWAQLFAGHGYQAYDVIRPAVWADATIPAWYRQNIVLYLDAPSAASLALEPTDLTLLDRVHPAFWERANRELKYANALPESEVLRRQAAAAQQQ